MDASQEEDLEAAVGAALSALAEHLGGTSDTGGPVVNATQIKDRGELGVLLTDERDYVLGRVWVAFGGAVDAPALDLSNGGAIHVQAEVCSEVVDPPVSIGEWLAAQ
jgi:hypothetical protein